MGQVVNIHELLDIVSGLRAGNKAVATTNGCFDILHAGHVRYLKQARELGDVLVVCLNSDDSVKRLKGPTRPLNPQDDRAEVLAALGAVDYVIIFDEDTPSDILARIKPDIHVKGGDYTEDTLPEAEIIKAAGGRIAFIPLVEGRSTTNVIKRMNSSL